VIAPCTTRIDVEVLAGEPLDMLIPILDDNNDPVSIPAGTETAWSAGAQVRRNVLATTVLHEWSTAADPPNALIIPGDEAKIRLTATATETTTWQTDWPDWTCSWSLELTEPAINGGAPHRLAQGLFRINPETTR
jgi:hypothetical protein